MFRRLEDRKPKSRTILESIEMDTAWNRTLLNKLVDDMGDVQGILKQQNEALSNLTKLVEELKG